jgi:hypothetical protein
MRRRVKIALATGLAVLLAALALTLSRAPLRVAGTNGVSVGYIQNFTPENTVVCVGGGSVPEGTRAVRVSLSANIGPRMTLRVLAGSTLVSVGTRAAGWGVDETVTVPVARVPRTIHGARICATVAPAVESMQIAGERVQGALGAHRVRFRAEYLRPGRRSWLSLAASIARHMGFAHAPGGAWVAYLTIATMLAVCLLATRLALRELR